MEKQIKLAGVTFANEKEDGGRNRQQILSEMQGYISVKLINTYFKGEKAIKVIEKSTRQVIGWIPKDKVDELWDTKEMTGFVEETLGTYHCTLTPIIYPNKEFYSKIKNTCERLGIKKPAYDYRAYKLAEKEIKKLERK